VPRTLYICHVIDLSAIAIYGEFQLNPVDQQSRIKKEASEQLDRLIGQQPVKWEPLITVGHTADEVSRLVDEKEIDVVIAATRGRSGLKRLILGSVTERLMRVLSCPLLVVHSPEHEFVDPINQKIRLKRILVGCDFSPDSDLAFQHALSLAQEFEADLHLNKERTAQPSDRKTHCHGPRRGPQLVYSANPYFGGPTLCKTGRVCQNRRYGHDCFRGSRARAGKNPLFGIDHRPGGAPGPLPCSFGEHKSSRLIRSFSY
jgi:nucleotide-binding universal stress UspA family protein